ncbi:MAG: hypothetical protein JWQ32_2952 [Marmoricola sp.]|nr:hypothetical protein [Marmoricola sp.]
MTASVPLRMKIATVILVVAAAASACSTGDKEAAKPLPGVGSHTPGSTVPSGDNGDLQNPVGDIRALSGFTCKPVADGSWSAAGTLTNAAGARGTYLVTVSIIKTKGNTVVAQASRTITLAKGATKHFAVNRVYKNSGKGLSCAPRVVVQKGSA